MMNMPPTSASAPPPASTPSSMPTPTMPIATPTRLAVLARCSPLSAKASRNVKIGAVATRIPVSDDEMRSSPSPISVSGTATCTNASIDDRAEAAAKAAEDAALQRERHEHERGERGPDRDDRPGRHAVLQRDLDEEVRRAPERAEQEQQDERAAGHRHQLTRWLPLVPMKPA